MTLREQVTEVGLAVLGAQYLEAVSFPVLVDALALKLFRRKTPYDSLEARVVLRALELFETEYCVSMDAPAVE